MKILLLSLLLLLTGCTLTREEVKSQETTKETTKNEVIVKGTAGGLPLNLVVTQKGTTQANTTKEETKETTSPVVESGFNSLIELILGTSGAGVIAMLWRKLVVSNGTLKGIVDVIETQPEKTKKSLLPSFSKRLDKKHKDLIKKMKG
jgi:hypothetical protein